MTPSETIAPTDEPSTTAQKQALDPTGSHEEAVETNQAKDVPSQPLNRPNEATTQDVIPNPEVALRHTEFEHEGIEWRRIATALGWSQVVVLIGGTLGIIVAMGFLRCLWPWQRRGEPNSFWAAIIFSDWTPRAITLSSLVIRISVTAQAVVMCMMTASTALHRGQITFQDAAAVSLFRFSNSGPHNMVLPLVRCRSHKKFMLYLAISVMSLTTLTTFGAQLSSTILLLDIGIIPIKTMEKSISIFYGVNKYDEMSLYSTWDQVPTPFSIFAERANPHIDLHDHKGGGSLFSTGQSLRALLPLPKLERESLADYSGPAAVLDSRVVCISPNIINLSIYRMGTNLLSKDQAQPTSNELHVRGTLGLSTLSTYSEQLKDFGFFTNLSPYNFDSDVRFVCKLPKEQSASSALNYNEWKTSLCKIEDKEIRYILGSADNGYIPLSTVLDLGLVVINITGNWDMWPSDPGAPSTIPEPYGYGEDNDSEWTKITYPVPNGNTPELLELKLSLCLTSFKSANALVKAHGNWNLTEPTLSALRTTERQIVNSTIKGQPWVRPAGSGYDVTAEIRNQLGVGPNGIADHRARGILQLVEVDQESFSELQGTGNYINRNLLDQKLDPSELHPSPTAQMCNGCDVDLCLHGGFITIFENTLRTTNHPALAIQAFLTARALQVYNYRMDDFLVPGTAQAIFFELFHVPTKFTGFSIVFCILCAHFILVSHVVLLYLRDLDWCSFLGQAWHVVAQVSSVDTNDILDFAKTVNDKEVDKFLVEKGDKKARVQIKDRVIMRRGSTDMECLSGNEAV